MSKFGDCLFSVRSLLKEYPNDLRCVMKTSCELLENIFDYELMLEFLDYLEENNTNDELLEIVLHYKTIYKSYLE